MRVNSNVRRHSIKSELERIEFILVFKELDFEFRIVHGSKHCFVLGWKKNKVKKNLKDFI